MTNLLIGYSDIPRRASLTVSPAAATGYGGDNASLGSRRLMWMSGSAGTSHTLTYDLGSGVTAATNFFYVAAAQWIAATTGVSIALAGGSDGITFGTTAATFSSVTSANLTGPRAEDLITTFAATSALRYWRVTVSSASSITPRLSKVMFGTMLDLGRDPDWGRRVDVVSEHNGVRARRYKYSFQWRSLSAAAKDAFISALVDWQDVQPVVLYSSSYHDVLKNDRAVHCRLLPGYTITPRTSTTWDIGADFEEVL